MRAREGGRKEASLLTGSRSCDARDELNDKIETLRARGTTRFFAKLIAGINRVRSLAARLTGTRSRSRGDEMTIQIQSFDFIVEIASGHDKILFFFFFFWTRSTLPIPAWIRSAAHCVLLPRKWSVFERRTIRQRRVRACSLVRNLFFSFPVALVVRFSIQDCCFRNVLSCRCSTTRSLFLVIQA